MADFHGGFDVLLRHPHANLDDQHMRLSTNLPHHRCGGQMDGAKMR